MLNNKKIIAIIPARQGSKGIKDKNIRLLNGKPLIYYSISAAKNSKYIDNIVVSTDSEKIANIAKKYGACIPFMRPKKFANDKSKIIDSVIYTLSRLKKMGFSYDILVLLQPTSPLRTQNDIDKALKLFVLYGKSVVSINKVDVNPFLIRSISENNKLNKLLNKCSTLRRQDLPDFYRVNGAIYINDIKTLSHKTSLNDNTIGYIMNSANSLDIDSHKDLYKARLLIRESMRDKIKTIG